MEGVRPWPARRPARWSTGRRPAKKALASGGELVSRDTAGAVHQQLWLDWQACATLAPEERLSRLAAWVLAAQRAGAEYGLVLPGASIEPRKARRTGAAA